MLMSENIDKIDREILKIIQADATRPLEDIAARVSVSTNTCWRRVRKLELAGVIQRRVAILDPHALGLVLTVFVSVSTADHSDGWLKRFAAAVDGISQITEFYRLAGETDYLLKIMARSVADYDEVYKRLIAKIDLADVSASFAMETIKHDTALPI
ncbi:MAG: Lrp/AsnC family transcriptional regulator [Parvularculaceae bacterium]